MFSQCHCNCFYNHIVERHFSIWNAVHLFSCFDGFIHIDFNRQVIMRRSEFTFCQSLRDDVSHLRVWSFAIFTWRKCYIWLSRSCFWSRCRSCWLCRRLIVFNVFLHDSTVFTRTFDSRKIDSFILSNFLSQWRNSHSVASRRSRNWCRLLFLFCFSFSFSLSYWSSSFFATSRNYPGNISSRRSDNG